MPAEVYFLPSQDNEDDSALANRLKSAIGKYRLFSFIEPRDLVAIKTHFGEKNSKGYVRPAFFRKMADLIRKEKGNPFLAETSTLYRGSRSNAVDHLILANEHGFTYDKCKLPVIICDGLLGDEETAIEIKGRIYQSVQIAAQIVKAQSLVVVTHFTGHIATGFGGTLKNLGMGCASRRGKLIQHSTAQPDVKNKKCTGCSECIKWCPQDAIHLTDNNVATINSEACIGCGECLAVCRFDAIHYNWSETYEQLQRKVVEHAMGVAATKTGKALYFNFLTRISKDCDCMGRFERIAPDIGILISTDPVALDQASLDMVEAKMAKPLNQIAFDIPYRIQIEYAVEIGFGQADYQIIPLD